MKFSAIRTIVFSLSFFLFFFTPLLVFCADVPELVHYEGFLSDTNGYAVSDGSYNVTFRLYSTFAGGTALWTENWNDSTSRVPVMNGRFRILLGSHVPLTSTFFQQHPATFLGITVGNDSEMIPRQRIASVPYALSSAGSSLPAGGIIMWSGAISDIPSGWAICDGTNGTPDLRNRFVVGAGGSYNVQTTGGEATHVLTVAEMPNHTHSGPRHRHRVDPPATTSSGQSASHHHNFPASNENGGSSSAWNRTATGSIDGYHNTGNASNDHTHSVNIAPFWSDYEGTGTTGSRGGGVGHNNLPPYYALAFIMKL